MIWHFYLSLYSAINCIFRNCLNLLFLLAARSSNHLRSLDGNPLQWLPSGVFSGLSNLFTMLILTYIINYIKMLTLISLISDRCAQRNCPHCQEVSLMIAHSCKLCVQFYFELLSRLILIPRYMSDGSLASIPVDTFSSQETIRILLVLNVNIKHK